MIGKALLLDRAQLGSDQGEGEVIISGVDGHQRAYAGRHELRIVAMMPDQIVADLRGHRRRAVRELGLVGAVLDVEQRLHRPAVQILDGEPVAQDFLPHIGGIGARRLTGTQHADIMLVAGAGIIMVTDEIEQFRAGAVPNGAQLRVEASIGIIDRELRGDIDARTAGRYCLVRVHCSSNPELALRCVPPW